MVYRWRSGSRIKADAQLVGKEVESLGKEIEPCDLVELAKDAKTESHLCFEWDDGEAAHQYRLSQARDILGALVFIEDGDDSNLNPTETQIRVYENVVLNRGEENCKRAYVPLKRALANDDLRVQVFARLGSMLHEAETTAEKYEGIYEQLRKVREKAHEARKALA